MSYFNLNLNTDIDYLIREIGHDIKVNNKSTRAIVNNINSSDYDNDDKRLITKHEILRGDYIRYNNKYWLVISQVNSKIYNTYNKFIIRNCELNVKFIIDDKLYLFYAVVEGAKFGIDNTGFITLSDDTILVTIPLNKVTQKIDEKSAFLKWGKKWTVHGINYTKKGLIVLTCKHDTISKTADDKENEIADRYDRDNNDRLNGNIMPIYPFEDVEIIEVDKTKLQEVVNNAERLNSDDYTEETWNTLQEIILSAKSIIISENATQKEVDNVLKDLNNAIDNLIAKPEEAEPSVDNYAISIEGASSMTMFTTPQEYVATVYQGSTSVNKEVKFELNNSLASITKQGNNICTVEMNKNYNYGKTILKATLIDDENTFTEKEIMISSF